MRIQDALNILGVEPKTGKAEIRDAYLTACKIYHPDINPAGVEMMKAVNTAYDTLKEYIYKEDMAFQDDEINLKYGKILNTALNAVIKLNLNIEVCGAWIWISGNTYAVKDILKKADYRYASKKKSWYFRPSEYKSRNRRTWGMDKIRSKYGSRDIKSEDTTRIYKAVLQTA